MNETKEKIAFLESLRGIAALSVVIFHFKIGSILNNGFTDRGFLMVNFFFLLSGFVIALNYSEKIKDFFTLKNYMIKRFFRLYPLHIFTLFMWLGIESSKYLFFINGLMDSTEDNIPFSKNNLSTFLMHLFLVQNIFTDELTWNGPSWSISVEFYTYLFFGMFLIFIKFFNDEGKKLIVLTIIFVVFISFLLHLISPTKMLLECIFGFFLGALLYYLPKYDSYLFTSNITSYLLTLLSILATIYLYEHFSVVSIIYFINIYYLLSINRFTHKKNYNFVLGILNLRPLIFLGTISYGVYLVHSPILGATIQVLKFFTEVTMTSDGYHVIKGFSLIHLEILMFSILGIVILFSYLCYKFIEIPFLNFQKKII